MDTSGRAVLFAGITVIISLMGLFLMGLSFVQGIAIASSLGVLMMILGSLTLLPALLGWVGTRIDNTTRAALIAVALGVVGAFVGVLTEQGAHLPLRPARWRSCCSPLSFFVKPLRKLIPHRARAGEGERIWYRWSRFIQRRPWPRADRCRRRCCVILAIPLFGIRLGFGDYGNYPEDNTVRRAYDLLAEGFGPGTNGPLFVTVEGEAATDEAALGAVRRAESTQAENVATAVPDPINDEPRAGRSSTRRAPRRTPRRRRSSTQLRDDVDPGVRRRRQGRRLHRRIDRLLQLPRRSHAAADRRRAAAQLPAADGGVPQRPRAAQGRGHEPAVDRRRLRHHRRHLPVGLGQGR